MGRKSFWIGFHITAHHPEKQQETVTISIMLRHTIQKHFIQKNVSKKIDLDKKIGQVKEWPKAWNDQVRMIMWLELIMVPMRVRLGKLLIWFDNCGCHKTSIVQRYIEDSDIGVAYLPPNMTAVLQVLDLVVNGPLKSHVRQLRAKRIVRSFKEFLVLHRKNLEKIETERENLTFTPPVPKQIQAIVDLFKLFENDFKEEKFKDGIKS